MLTGVTSGIGYQLVKLLAAKDYTIVFIARNKKKAEELKHELIKNYHIETHYYLADLSDLEQVRAISGQIANDFPRINLFIANAGIMNRQKIYNQQGIEQDLAVNFLSNYILTVNLYQSLAAAAPARAIYTNSIAHKWCRPKFDDLNWQTDRFQTLTAYCRSKLLQMLMMKYFARKIPQNPIKFYAIHPGNAWTNIFVKYDKASSILRMLMRLALRSPHSAAKAIFRLTDDKFDYPTGSYFSVFRPSKPSKFVENPGLQQKAIEIAQKLTGVNLNL